MEELQLKSNSAKVCCALASREGVSYRGSEEGTTPNDTANGGSRAIVKEQ